METKFTKQQQKAYELLLKGENLFLTGPAGTGKSLVLNTFRTLYSNIKQISITSTTGVSALLICGSTVHSYLGIGLGTDDVDELYKKINKNSAIKNRWKNIEVLVIDEISMMSPELLKKLYSPKVEMNFRKKSGKNKSYRKKSRKSKSSKKTRKNRKISRKKSRN